MTTVLIVDDEADVRDSVAEVLGREGYEVVTAENATVGLALLEDQPFDLLITDIIMPDIDGVRAIKRVRKSLPDLKIIAISGGGNFGQNAYQPQAITTTAFLQAAAEAGADWVITKPFQRADLVSCINRVLPAETKA